jgi:hypothetical protein
MSMHSFDPQIAARVGVNAAVLYQNIVWWCAKNAANRRNEHEGRFWTYNSVKAWAELFPYLTGSQIRLALEKLENDGLILSGNFNEFGCDRTKWYCPSEQIHLSENTNGIARKDEPIPDINTDIKPDSKHISAKADDGFDDFWQHVPKKAGKGQAKKAWRSALKKTDAETIIAAMQGYARQREGQDQQFTAHPATWLNGERWLDEAAPSQQDFYNQIQQHLQGNENALSGPDQNSSIFNHRLPAPVSAPEPSGQRCSTSGDFSDSRGGQRSGFDFIKPRRI